MARSHKGRSDGRGQKMKQFWPGKK